MRQRDGASAACWSNGSAGPSVYPYQPDGLWEDVSVGRRNAYKQEQGEDLYRRSMYTFWKRTCPPPALSTFDAPDRETCLVRRARTNTPLQALVLVPVGRAFASGTVRLQTELGSSLAASELPDSHSRGPAADRNDVGAEEFSGRRPEVQVRPTAASGTWLSELLPHTARIADDLCIIRPMHTEAINHDPAITFIQTGSQQPGRPSLRHRGCQLWPGQRGRRPAGVRGDDLARQRQATRTRACSTASGAAAFLPSSHQGVKLRSGRDPVLYLSDPAGSVEGRRNAAPTRRARPVPGPVAIDRSCIAGEHIRRVDTTRCLRPHPGVR